MKHLLFIPLTIGALGFSPLAIAADAAPQQAASQQSVTAASTTFTKKRYKIKGEWSLVEDGGVSTIVFNENFKTKGGPDLKVFLSKLSVAELNGENVTGDSVNIGVLKSKKGAQSYIVPADISLADYKSVVIHCEAYSVLWGGFDLPASSAP